MRSYRVTKLAWFGPKRYLGWGWTPTNWRGWFTTLVFVALNIAVTFWPRPTTATKLVATHLALTGMFLTAIIFTGDPPGGPVTPAVRARGR
jgi:hypothetical protein